MTAEGFEHDTRHQCRDMAGSRRMRAREPDVERNRAGFGGDEVVADLGRKDEGVGAGNLGEGVQQKVVGRSAAQAGRVSGAAGRTKGDAADGGAVVPVTGGAGQLGLELLPLRTRHPPDSAASHPPAAAGAKIGRRKSHRRREEKERARRVVIYRS